MQGDDAYYAEVSNLAHILHERKGNPLTGALDTWREAESIIRAQRAWKSQNHESTQAGCTALAVL